MGWSSWKPTNMERLTMASMTCQAVFRMIDSRSVTFIKTPLDSHRGYRADRPGEWARPGQYRLGAWRAQAVGRHRRAWTLDSRAAGNTDGAVRN